MADPRLSTVFDYADLRLHTDGTRVYQKSSNLRPGIIKVAVQNSKANWIARDAGGSGKIPKMRPRGKRKEQDAFYESEGKDAGALLAEAEAEIKEDIGSDEEESGEEGKSSKQTKKRKGKPVDKRKAKRQKFANDYDYLLPKPSGPHEVEAHIVDDEVNDEAISLPEPSPDLLKCIHRFAAEFYSERGQLLNISREYRKQRKKRAQKRARERLRASRKEEGLDSLSDSLSSEGSKSQEGSEEDPASNEETEEDDDDEEEHELDSDDHGAGPSTSQNKRKKGKPKGKGRRRAGKLYTDMYKMFDGSAIMALGMLVQEHIAHLLIPQAPPGWDEEMRNFFDSQRSEEGGRITTGSSEKNDDIVDDDDALSHDADRDDEQEEAEDEQSSPRNGNITKREVNHSAETICDLNKLTILLYVFSAGRAPPHLFHPPTKLN
ncbi:hypothetical protein M413DRAFT_14802 [Hebeloma cylindrosporum]|uniref:Uncharacterized protein n=1 Tax=Hebeloma cylindrosporum TaxID=76867 RepID=A0A0C2XAH8_HEBCY|nr:hypothetical protein M413DRAFT_14802 [Hebeloma cylindrosporum h7]